MLRRDDQDRLLRQRHGMLRQGQRLLLVRADLLLRRRQVLLGGESVLRRRRQEGRRQEGRRQEGRRQELLRRRRLQPEEVIELTAAPRSLLRASGVFARSAACVSPLNSGRPLL